MAAVADPQATDIGAGVTKVKVGILTSIILKLVLEISKKMFPLFRGF